MRSSPKNLVFSASTPDDVYRSVMMNADAMVINSETKFGVITLMDAIAAKSSLIKRLCLRGS